MSTGDAPLTYGNWIRPRTPGVFGLSLASTTIAFVAIIAALFVQFVAGWRGALVVLVLAVVPIALNTISIGHRSLGAQVMTFTSWRRRKSAGAHLYSTGAMSNLPRDVGRPLPGVLARTELTSVTDAQDRQIAVLHHRGRNYYTAVLRCYPDGIGLVGREVADTWVANWGGVLATLGAETGLRGAAVIVDSAPDLGRALRVEHARTRSPNAPRLAARIMDEAVANAPVSSPDTAVFIALTWRGLDLHRPGNDAAAVGVEIARALPQLIAVVESAGGGTVDPVLVDELPGIIRTGFDPAIYAELADAAANGQAPDLDWSEAGPVTTVESWGSLRHDSGISVTYEAVEAPRGAVTSNVLGELLSAHHDFARKRVALLYRPMGPGKAADVTEAASNIAAFTSKGAKGRVTSTAERVIAAARQAEHEVAAGAGLTRFAIMATVTVNDPADLEQAESTLVRLGRTSRIKLRRCSGHQAAAFATTLPVGFMPWDYATAPSVS